MANPFFIWNERDIFEPFEMFVNLHDTIVPQMPAAREETEIIPGQDGDLVTEISYGPRVFDMVLRSSDGMSESEKMDLKEKIKATLNKARGQDVELLFLKLRRTYYVRPSGAVFEIIQEYPSWFECRIPLTAHDPYGYEAYDKKIRGSQNLQNIGNEFAHTRVSIVGPAINPYFVTSSLRRTLTSQVEKGTRYEFRGVVGDGETLEVDSLSQTAYIIRDTDRRNVTGDWCGKFLTLPVGETRIMAEFNVNIRYFNRWI